MNGTSKVVSNRALLALIGRRIPQIYDVIPRHGQEMLGQPRPIPWLAAGMDLGRMAVLMAQGAQRSGGKPEVMADLLDEWCPVGKPIPLPWPYPWDDRPPRPEEKVDMRELHLGVALGLAAAGLRVQDQRLNAVIDQAIDRSLGALG